ncbi:metallophosphoesterase [Bacillus canaveralius]|uniref:metallophosphoesterase n=1 Tax=Bacillus canaveralius TaxID=1403243 RepID=UPI000F77FFA6|nr:metallophosphoesterase [Bacillus canaveralius]RSK53066.1 metallophosphoesterase [Bacillus canaveralius]
MAKTVTRRKFIKRAFVAVFTCIAASFGAIFYAREIEPKLLDITTYPIKNPVIPKGFEGFKIVQFSDTHLGFQYDLKQLKRLIDKINKLVPDLILFTGDLMDAPNKYEDTDKIVLILSQLNAPFGKFAVYGNHDHGGYGSDIYKDIMSNSGFSVLLNESRRIELLDHSSIYVIGVDDAMLGKPNLSASVQNVPDDAYQILLSHAPDLADEAATFGIGLQLSGHSHGGQVQIPFVGALITPPFAERYHEGFYEVGGAAPLTLYVNRGLGTTRLPFRFLSKPELTIFTLSSGDLNE